MLKHLLCRWKPQRISLSASFQVDSWQSWDFSSALRNNGFHEAVSASLISYSGSATMLGWPICTCSGQKVFRVSLAIGGQPSPLAGLQSASLCEE